MKTCLYTTSFLDGQDAQGNDRLERTLKYLEYYRHLKDELGFDTMIFADNASSFENQMLLKEHGGNDIQLICYEERLTRSSIFGYPYCWRGLYEFKNLIDEGYDKIINIDTDCFVLTNRAADYIKSLDSGWTTFWCPKYAFPESAIQILCKDAFPKFLAFIDQCHWKDWDDKAPMEKRLPFTHIDRTLNCDRWGEFNLDHMRYQDIYCQANNSTLFKYNKYI